MCYSCRSNTEEDYTKILSKYNINIDEYQSLSLNAFGTTSNTLNSCTNENNLNK